MKHPVSLAVLLLAAASAQAQVRVEVALPLPVITFQAPPPVVLVQPGLQVVENSEEEVFLVDRFYWTRHGGRWYRSPDHRGHWVLVERGVPPALVRLPPGQYRRWTRERAREEERREKGKHEKHEKREERGKH